MTIGMEWIFLFALKRIRGSTSNAPAIVCRNIKDALPLISTTTLMQMLKVTESVDVFYTETYADIAEEFKKLRDAIIKEKIFRDENAGDYGGK